MDFGWSSSQSELYEQTVRFARGQLNRDLRERRSQRRFADLEFRACGAHGLLGLCVPVAHGGLGLDALTTARAIEGLGFGCEDMGLVFAAAAHLFACAMPIAEHADEALRARVLPRLASGEWIGANAITEPGAGSDTAALSTSARRDGDCYVLDGDKSYVTNGPVADCVVVYATVAPRDGFLGLTAFLVERATPGLVVGQPFATIGLETATIAPLRLEGCRVPAANRLGGEGQGAEVFASSMRWERSCLFAAYLGAMERQIDATVEYARERRQFRRPLGKHQAIAHRIADMKLRLDAARLLVYRACWLHDQGDSATVETAIAKLATSEAAIRCGLDAIQIHGGIGTIVEAGIERWLRDAVPATIFSGTSEIQRDLIARGLGL